MNNSDIEKFYNEVKNVPTKKKRRMLCNELWKAKKRKEYFKLLLATDEEVEQVFDELYNPFFESLITKNDYE